MSQTPAQPETPAQHEPGGFSRRRLLLGGGAGLAVGLAAGAGGALLASAAQADPEGVLADPPPTGTPVQPLGAHQAGVARPATPQRNAAVAVLDVPGLRSPATARELLAALTAAVASVTEPAEIDARVLPDGIGDLTVLVGLGPAVVTPLSAAAVARGGIDQPLPGAEPLPLFTGDERLPEALRTGDLLIIAASSDAAPLAAVIAHLTAALSGATSRWVQHGVRGAGTGTIARNPLGYLDGIVVPHGREELDSNVWIADGPAAGATVCVLRRFNIDVAGFAERPPAEQDAIVGRQRSDGAPLSGGEGTGEVDIMAKTPEGEFLIPLRSHVRAAHPSFTGADLMLRRSYGFTDGTQAGMTFISYQRDLATFIKTQHRLDELDDMMTFTTLTATGSFLVLPGRADGTVFGETLLAAAGV